MSNFCGEAPGDRGAMSNFRGEAPGDCGAMSNFCGEAPGDRGAMSNFRGEASKLVCKEIGVGNGSRQRHSTFVNN